MNITMVFPWIAFGAGVLWMFHKGREAKQKYIQKAAKERAEQEARDKMLDRVVAHTADQAQMAIDYPVPVEYASRTGTR